MNIKEHRIYKYMSEPVRIVGCTIDEIVLILGCFGLVMYAETVMYKLLFMVIGSLGVYGIKKFKKLAFGFSLMSYIHWTLGLRFGLSRHWPESWKRIWLP